MNSSVFLSFPGISSGVPEVFFSFSDSSDSSLFDVKQVGRMTRNTGAVWRLFRDFECLKSSQKHILWN